VSAPSNHHDAATARAARVRAARGLSWLLMGVGVLLLAFVGLARLHSALSSRSDLERFRTAREARQSEARGVEAASVAAGSSAARPVAPLRDISPDRSLWSEGRIAKYEASLKAELGLPIAVLRIPRLALEVPVWTGTDELTLNRGLGHISGTPAPGEPGNVGIAGHRDGFFRVLKEIAPGDAVELETLASVERFAVESTRIVAPEDVWVLAPTPQPSLTLVTCYPFYFAGKAPERFIVHAASRPAGGAGVGTQELVAVRN